MEGQGRGGAAPGLPASTTRGWALALNNKSATNKKGLSAGLRFTNWCLLITAIIPY
jgi:hypothetical protein